jgi:hypothetical protein
MLSPAAPSASDYRTFLNSLTGKAPANLTEAQVSNWQDVDLSTPTGQIINEIAKKFNSQNRLGIGNVNYKSDPGASYYSMNAQGVPQIDVPSKKKGDVSMSLGPLPQTVGHELVHANDHQVDQLNPKVWQNLGRLASGIDPSGAPPVPMKSFRDFSKSIEKIQKKIEPFHEFSKAYKVPDIEQEMANARQQRYQIPSILDSTSPNWPQLFNDINTQVTSTVPAGVVQNQGFHLPFASEFPAFMSERLTTPWGANQTIRGDRTKKGSQALSLPEARFVHSTLGNMGDAYPAAEYPTMNHHIMARRNSLENAYYPGTPATAGGVAVPPGVVTATEEVPEG